MQQTFRVLKIFATVSHSILLVSSCLVMTADYTDMMIKVFLTDFTLSVVFAKILVPN